jgi:hypothetical protein
MTTQQNEENELIIVIYDLIMVAPQVVRVFLKTLEKLTRFWWGNRVQSSDLGAGQVTPPATSQSGGPKVDQGNATSFFE